MNYYLRTVVAKLPENWQRELRRIHFARSIRRNRFRSDEPEFRLLNRLVAPGQTVLDIGANVGHYTAELSTLVGPKGRVIAFEPVPETFAVLTWNLQYANCHNVTLVNAAASDACRLVELQIPDFGSGMANYYQARISNDPLPRSVQALTLRIDDTTYPSPISLAKIDVEGHEAAVLSGMRTLLMRDKPILILETESDRVQADIRDHGYETTRLPSSPNILCFPKGHPLANTALAE